MSFRWFAVSTILAAILASTAGCELGFGKIAWNIGKKEKDVDDQLVDSEPLAISDSLALRDTIAQQGFIEGLRKMRVRGFGIVAGLGDRGSRECPRNIRERLLQDMYKRKAFQRSGLRKARITPEMMLDDLDTAVVVVEGEIPAAAQEGDAFDVMVRALPGTQTTSLEGGSLYSMELHLYRDTGAGSAVEGKALATAAGHIFVNPFAASENAATKSNRREGFVLGGGRVLENRRLRLVISRPSYRRAQMIEDRINTRFGGSRKIAKAVSPAYVELSIPKQFKNDPFHFLALVRHLYVSSQPTFLEQRARELAKEILDKNAPHADIALAWEGIGRTIIPQLQDIYASDQPHARFYSAVAGLRMGDDMALDVMKEFTKNPQSNYRLTAITELGFATHSTRAAVILRELLNDDDPRIRVEAYEALLARHDRVIRTRNVGPDNFALDLVPSTADNMIYIRRTKAPRIALFGDGLQCIPPVFYRDPYGLITINADTHDSRLTLIRKTPFHDRVSPPLPASLELAQLISMLGDDPTIDGDRQVHGLALDYSTVARTIQQLCESRATNAHFMLQTDSITDLFGPLADGERRESDL